MEEIISRPPSSLRSHFERFLRDQKVHLEEIEGGECQTDLKGLLSGEEVICKTERYEEALSNDGFSRVSIKTEKLDDETRIYGGAYVDDIGDVNIEHASVPIKTEKFDFDEVGVSCQPSTATPSLDAIHVKKEKEDTICVKTEKEETCTARLTGNNEGSFSASLYVPPIKIKEDKDCDIKCALVKTEKNHSSQQLSRDCGIKEEADDFSLRLNTDEVVGCHDMAGTSTHPPNPSGNTDVTLLGKIDLQKKQDYPENPEDQKCSYSRSRERKAKNFAKMMLKELEENLDLGDLIDAKQMGPFKASRHFISRSVHSSVPRRLHDMNNEFNKYKDDAAVSGKVDVQTLKKGLFSCSECSFRSHHIKELRVHQWKHRTDTAYHQCRECSYRTKWLPGIVSHVKRVHRKLKPFKCPHCEHKSASSTALKQHINIHTSNKPYKCPYCNYRSVAQASLRSHVYTHTGEKPYACPHCSYRCTQYPHLKSHLYVHTREKPYSCELCEYRTTQSTHLRSHMQVMHTKVKPYKCEHCSYASKSLTGLKIHVRKHTGERPYVCMLCPYKATQSTSLRVHMRGHLESRRCKCSVCGYSTHTPFSLKTHIASLHNTN